MAISNRVKQLWIGTKRTHPFAKRMRREATLAEQKLWLQLRDRRLAGVKFRRQMPIGPYIVDFISPGRQHDGARTAYLNQQGFRVIRVWNNDVLSRMEAVLKLLLLSLR